MGELFLKLVSGCETAQNVDCEREGIPRAQGGFVAISEVQHT